MYSGLAAALGNNPERAFVGRVAQRLLKDAAA